jgi:hypothetical protein
MMLAGKVLVAVVCMRVMLGKMPRMVTVIMGT